MRLFGIAMLGLLTLLGLMGIPDQIKHPTFAGVTIFLCLVVIPAYLIFKLVVEDKKAKEFIVWLTANKDSIMSGNLRYEGYPVTPTTVLRQYYFTISVLLVSMKSPTRYYIDQCHSTGLHSTMNTVLSLLFGWWGFPWGPVYTIQAVAKNIRGGQSTTVAQLLDAMK